MTSLSLIPLSPWKLMNINNGGNKKQVRKANICIKCCSSSDNQCEAIPSILIPSDQRILEKAFKEPVAFMGGVFAGLLRLDLNEDPLKEWVTRTVEASGFTDEELDSENITSEEVPQEIEIE
uniref:UPF0426 protein At1g28150, chloroplastic n=1 Tax=Erigeron canadensis TaxID=72917 RepID=UPI001CB91CED|nr:UPF0426 protein At1g28150, chloroplastic [Erigeron canadensis]